MTKERKLAVKMWEDIKQAILDGTLTPNIPFSMYEAEIAKRYGANWHQDCWFCQYVRREYDRFGDFWEKTGKAKGLGEEGCNFCPLAKVHPLYDPSNAIRDCGCFLPGSPWLIICNNANPREKRVAACDIIIKALKGEPIEIQAPEEEI